MSFSPGRKAICEWGSQIETQKITKAGAGTGAKSCLPAAYLSVGPMIDISGRKAEKAAGLAPNCKSNLPM